MSTIEKAINDGKMIAIEKVKKGEMFKRPGKSVVYTAEGYDRFTKKYCGQKYEDINAFTYIKKGTLVEIDFTY